MGIRSQTSEQERFEMPMMHPRCDPECEAEVQIKLWTRGHSGLGVRLVAQLCQTLVTPWTVPHQVPLSMEFSRQEYWSGFPFHPPGDLPNSRIKPVLYCRQSPALQMDS